MLHNNHNRLTTAIQHFTYKNASALKNEMICVGWLVFNGTFSTNRLHRAIGVWDILPRAGTRQIHNLTMKQYTKTKVINTLRPWLCGDNCLAMIRLPQRSLSSQLIGKCWQLNQNNQKTEYTETQTKTQKSGHNKHHKRTQKTQRDRRSLV